MKKIRKLEIVYKKISDLIPYARNAKRHSKKQIELVAASLVKFGWLQPLVIDSKNILIVGHCRYASALSLGVDEVPVVFADYLTEDEVKEYRLLDNKSNESAWDMDLTIDELKDLQLKGRDISITGFTLELGDKKKVEEEKAPSVSNLQYTLVFSSEDDYTEFTKFLRKLKNDYQDFPLISQRLIEYIKNHD